MRIVAAAVGLVCLSLPAFGAQQASEKQSVLIGPWTISTTHHADKFVSCSMSRSASDLEITFLKKQDGLFLTLDSPKWKLERGKTYTVKLLAGRRDAEVKALAEKTGVTIAFADGAFNEHLRTANVLEVRGEGATLRVPLDKSAIAFERLEACFERNSRESPETNPFVAPTRRP